MSAEEVVGSSGGVVSGAEFRREAVRLGQVQAATMALQDATSFLRNTYIVSTAALAEAMAGALAGEAGTAERLAQIQSGLEAATAQYERVVKISSRLLSDQDATTA